MNEEWSTRYYRSLEWCKCCIASFLVQMGRGDVMKSKEAKRVWEIRK